MMVVLFEGEGALGAVVLHIGGHYLLAGLQATGDFNEVVAPLAEGHSAP